MHKQTIRLIGLLLVGASLIITGCSSSSSEPSDSTDSNYSDGAPSNTGIARQPLASTVPFSATRPETIDLDYLTDLNGFSLSIASSTGTNGRDFSSLGDVNGDAVPDFMFTTTERTVVVYGGSSLNNLNLLDIPDTAGFSLDYAIALKRIGDINDDGIDDIGWDTYDAGLDATGVRVVFGKRDGSLKQAVQSPVIGTDGFDISNSARLLDIRSVASAGDLNADGINDLFIGGFGLNGVDHTAPNAWVLYGSAAIGVAKIDVSQLQSGQGLTLVSPLSDAQLNAVYDDTGTGYNASIASEFDLNGDGIDDIALGTERFDWLENTGESRTYVVFGASSRSNAEVDMTMLDGEYGLRIVTPAVPYTPGPDRVISIGDLDGNGFNDLAIHSNRFSLEATSVVIFGGVGISGAIVDRSAIPTGGAMVILDSTMNRGVEYLSSIGDLDGNGSDELGVVFSQGIAAIVYGDEDSRPASIDLNAPDGTDVTYLRGMSDSYTLIDDNPLQALGDINGDGVDDLGIGWDERAYEAGVSVIDDINGDNVSDLLIGPTVYASVSLLRVLYGYDSIGFTGVLAGSPDIQPVAIVEENYFNALINSVDAAANYAIGTLNTTLSSGGDVGPTANACLIGSSGVESGEIDQFDCDANPILFSYNWGGGKYSGTGEAQFTTASVINGKAKTLSHGSAPLPSAQPGGNPFSAFVNYDAMGTIEISNGVNATDNAIPKRLSCTIDIATRITQDDPDVCLGLIRSTTSSLEAVFGLESSVTELSLLP